MDAVCFDMDGVLVDSEDYWEPRERGDLLPRAVPDERVDLEEVTGMNYREIYDHLAAEYDVAMGRAEFLAWFEDTATTIYGEEVALLPGAPDLLGTLRERGVSVALVSSSPHAWIDVVRERFDLSFDAVVSADALDGPGKPDPAVYRHAAAELGADPDGCVAVEDSRHGIESASRAGFHVVGFRHGSPDDTDRSRADYVAADPADLRAHLTSLLDG